MNKKKMLYADLLALLYEEKALLLNEIDGLRNVSAEQLADAISECKNRKCELMADLIRMIVDLHVMIDDNNDRVKRLSFYIITLSIILLTGSTSIIYILCKYLPMLALIHGNINY